MSTMQLSSLSRRTCNKPTTSPTTSIVHTTSSNLKPRCRSHHHHHHDGGSSGSTVAAPGCHSLKLNEKQSFLRRREAVGLGLCFSFVELVFQEADAANAISVACEFTTTPSGLAYCDKVVGAPGSQPLKGQLIKAHYTGKLEDGKVFDSSYNRGKPLTFRVGVGEVIKGWDQGILGGDGVPPMLAGGKRTLKIPPELGYGIRGAGCKGGTCIIPPNSVLLFDVEFIGKA